MYKKTIILGFVAFASMPAFAGTINLIGISYSVTGTAKGGSTTVSYNNSNSNLGSWTADANGVSGQQFGYASSGIDVSNGANSLSSGSYAYGTASVTGLGTASGTASSWALVKFELTSDALVNYAFLAESQSSGGTTNNASIRLTTDATAGGSSLVFAGLGDNLSGSTLLTAGEYSLEIYSKSTVSARSRSAASSASGFAYSQSAFDLSAQAVPEPASMAVLALGGAALLRRRKKA